MLIHLDDIFENIKQLKKEDQIKLFTDAKFLELILIIMNSMIYLLT